MICWTGKMDGNGWTWMIRCFFFSFDMQNWKVEPREAVFFLAIPIDAGTIPISAGTWIPSFFPKFPKHDGSKLAEDVKHPKHPERTNPVADCGICSSESWPGRIPWSKQKPWRINSSQGGRPSYEKWWNWRSEGMIYTRNCWLGNNRKSFNYIPLFEIHLPHRWFLQLSFWEVLGFCSGAPFETR